MLNLFGLMYEAYWSTKLIILREIYEFLMAILLKSLVSCIQIKRLRFALIAAAVVVQKEL